MGSFFEEPLKETSRLYLLICWSTYRYLNSEDFKPEPLQIDIEKLPTYQTLREYDELLKVTIKNGIKTREFVDLIRAEIDSIETLIKNFNGYSNEKPGDPIYGSFTVSNELIEQTECILERLKSRINEYIKISDNNIIEMQHHIDVSSSMINLNLQHKMYILTIVIIFLTIVQLKTEIINFIKKDLKMDIEDLGCYSKESVDYPDYAVEVCKKVIKNNSVGILICSTGIGVSISANRIKGIRCALCSEEYSASMARRHNDANVLALGGKVIGVELAKSILKTFLNSRFEGGRHKRRIDKIDLIEKNI